MKKFWGWHWPTFWVALVAGLIVLFVSVVVSPLYVTRLTSAVKEDGKLWEPQTTKISQDTRDGERVSLFEATVRVRNVGLKTGGIHSCESGPLGAAVTPSVQITKIDQSPVFPFKMRDITVRYLVTETSKTAPYNLQYQVTCFNTDGTLIFRKKAFWRRRSQ